jgi:molybdate transport system ATP-binding protein
VGVAATLRVELAQHLADFPGLALVVTHDAIDALTLATEVLVLDDGAVAQRGTPAEVAARPRTDHVARLVGLNVHRDGDSLRAFRPSAVTVSADRPVGSARHVWHGRISGLAAHGDAVRLSVDAGPIILADITPAAAAEMALAPGREVWLAVKETAVDWYPAHPH